MSKKIVWESVHNEEPIDDDLDDMDDIEDHGFTEDDVDWEAMKSMRNFKDFNEPQQLVQTPFGLYHVKDTFNPLKQFVWWMGHTNFNISPRVANVLNSIPGVEFIKIISRYRFLIAIGKAFDFSSVRAEIEESLDVLASNKKDDVEFIAELKAKHEKWAIFYFNDDTYDVIVDDEYDEEIENFIELEKNSKGKLLTYNDI